jgi:hypothetical protein
MLTKSLPQMLKIKLQYEAGDNLIYDTVTPGIGYCLISVYVFHPKVAGSQKLDDVM